MYKGAFVSTKANIYHTATSIDEFIKKNSSTVLVIIFNFTRQQEAHNVYQALEELKDGMVTSEKYKGRTIYFNVPHLVVFANYLPEVKHLTIDRWDIRILHNEKIIKRYLAGQIVHQAEFIDPYISDRLQGLENDFTELGYPCHPFDFSKLNQTPAQPGAPLNIKRGAPLASLVSVPPSAPQISIKSPTASLQHSTSSKAAAPLVPPSAPQMSIKSPTASPQQSTLSKAAAPLVPPSAPRSVSIEGDWINGYFHAKNPPINSQADFILNGKTIPGHWIGGIFYPDRKL